MRDIALGDWQELEAITLPRTQSAEGNGAQRIP